MSASKRPERSFAEVLTEAVAARGLSLERIRFRLEEAGVPVSVATLSYWQSGRSLPTRARSYHTLVELESILDVEPGYLTQLTYTSDGRSKRELFEWQKVVPAREVAEQIINDLDLALHTDLSRVTLCSFARIRDDRTELGIDTTVDYRTERPGLPRWPLVLLQDSDTEAVPAVEVLFGARLGRQVEVPKNRLLVAEMEGLKPMGRGEHFSVRYRVKYGPTTTPSYRVMNAIAETTKVLTLVAVFDPNMLPSRVERTFQTEADAEPSEVTEVEVTGCEAQAIWIDAPPGVYTLQWEWD